MMSSENVLKAMADPTRLKIMQALLRHELSVTEIVAMLAIPQSTVSRHLKVLRNAELISDRRNGVTVHYAPSSVAMGGDNDSLQSRLARWLEDEPVPRGLQERLQRVLEQRHAETVDFFESVGQRWDQMRTDCFGNSFHLEALTTLLPKSWVVADIGAGTGYLLPGLAAVFEKVIAVEPVPALLEVARSRLGPDDVNRVDLRRGDLRGLPIEDGEVDLAIAMLVLHHVPDPDAALAEVGRVVRSGGRILVVEQQAHRCEAFRELMHGRWWGFEPDSLAAQVRAAGFQEVIRHDLRTAGPTSASVPQTPDLFVLTGKRQEARGKR
ncbi:MAG: ArsR family transcriptional regulator [Phycisphaerae bacterium]|nr:ArsR family transcriptional regulator [Phycisphaerae bacterium]